jgi:hypothetical protein
LEGVNEEEKSKLQEYVEQLGIKTGFELIFTEIMENKIPQDKVYQYTIARLRELAYEIREKGL